MSERARIMGGTLSIVSRLNQGTQVQAAVPMTACVKVDVRPDVKGQVA
jgi:signal transduction histidine kinase